ncbi:TraK family protein [Methylobacter psychrophilus]|uniref:TraK family protein n=1 Tax=Methylobacter psychrophilus TaxID=96941 RepID=UPI0021D4EE99|nr:TraK family protein [Methylobacter psychrophilus]
MTKKLSERIAERAKIKQQSRNARNRAQFLSVRDELQEALDDNWTIKDLWETLHAEGAITFSYQAFRTHLLAWQTPSPQTASVSPKRTIKPTNPSDCKKDETTDSQKTQATEKISKGFIFDSSPKKEDYI